MGDVIKVLMECNLPREVAKKIDLEARRMHFKETRIQPFDMQESYIYLVYR